MQPPESGTGSDQNTEPPAYPPKHPFTHALHREKEGLRKEINKKHKGKRPAHKQKRRRLGRRILIGTLCVVVALVGLLAASYGYFEWKLTTIKTLHCRSCHPVAKPEDPFNVLIVGSDSRQGESGPASNSFGSAQLVTGQRSDTIKIVHVDPTNGTASVLSIPRDTFVTLSGLSASSELSKENKINASFDSGIDPLIQTIQNTFGIPINHFVTIDFSGVINLVNAVGGISLNFPYPARDDDDGNNNSGLQITHSGCQVLNGDTALALARSRYFQYFTRGSWRSDPSSDLGRIERQNVVISAVIDKAKGNLNPFSLNSLLNAVVSNVTKDSGLSGNDLVTLATHYHAFSGSQLRTWTLPTVGAYNQYAGDVETVQQPQAEDTVEQFLGSPPTLPIITPPLDSSGEPQTPSTPQAITTQPLGTGTSAESQSTPATSTTIPEQTPSTFDPIPC